MILLISILLLFITTSSCLSYNKMINETYNKLSEVRKSKAIKITELFNRVEAKAEALNNDEIMHKFFFFMDNIRNQKIENNTEAESIVSEYRKAIDTYYLNKYMDFYDILFIDNNGEIFYTIRKEGDYKKNIFKNELSKTKLSKSLSKSPNLMFVDYQYYSPADEPAAFFIVPIMENGVQKGWIVLQYAINKLNTMMVDYEELGDTGEIYLVNKDHLILTNSRFKAEDVSLQLKVDTEAVNSAFISGEGHQLITGYRGVRVFTSFEKLSLWGADWALVASIEEDEIVTDYYLKNRTEIAGLLFNILASQSIPMISRPAQTDKYSKVDIDEYKKAPYDSVLETRGVSTCTAITVSFPDKFSYLAHISPYDKIYGQVNLTNQLKELIGKITYNDIYLRELRNLKIVIVANHVNSIETIIDKLTSYGIRLSQITFVYNPTSRYANVSTTGNGNKTYIDWVYPSKSSTKLVQDASSVRNLGEVVREIANKIASQD